MLICTPLFSLDPCIKYALLSIYTRTLFIASSPSSILDNLSPAASSGKDSVLTTATFGLATMRTTSPHEHAVEATTAPDTTASGHASMLTTSPITHTYSVEDTPEACVRSSQSFTPTSVTTWPLARSWTWLPSSALPTYPSSQHFCHSSANEFANPR